MARAPGPADESADDGSSSEGRREGTNRRTRVAPRGTGRAATTRFIAQHRLDEFHRILYAIAVAVFGPAATVVPHLRRVARGPRLTFVVDAADPSALVSYEAFLPREQAFWTAYAQLPKPKGVSFVVAIRPARGWSRGEALAPFFAWLPRSEQHT